MIKGIGVDIVEIKRLNEAFNRWGERFQRKVFTSKEIQGCQLRSRAKLAYLAGRFAAKEAVFKSLEGGISWQDIEILAAKNGKPCLYFGERIKEVINKKGIKRVLISISHDSNYAIAQAIAIGREE